MGLHVTHDNQTRPIFRPSLEKYMKASTKKLLGVAVAALTIIVASCGSSSNESADTSVAEAQGPKVVASTSWVAAFAKLAGATDITVIAPSNLQHPPDYDPKASDLEAVADDFWNGSLLSNRSLLSR